MSGVGLTHCLNWVRHRQPTKTAAYQPERMRWTFGSGLVLSRSENGPWRAQGEAEGIKGMTQADHKKVIKSKKTSKPFFIEGHHASS